MPIAIVPMGSSAAKEKAPEKKGDAPAPVADARSAAGANAALVPGAEIMCMTDAGAVLAASSMRIACCVTAPDAFLSIESISMPSGPVVVLVSVVEPVVPPPGAPVVPSLSHLMLPPRMSCAFSDRADTVLK